MGLKRVHLYTHNRQSTICNRETRKVACADLPAFLRILIDDHRGSPVHACKNCSLILGVILHIVNDGGLRIAELTIEEREKLFEKLSALEEKETLTYGKQKEMRAKKGEQGVWSTGAPKGGRWKRTVVSAYSSGDSKFNRS